MCYVTVCVYVCVCVCVCVIVCECVCVGGGGVANLSEVLLGCMSIMFTVADSKW